jgi:hypothetical protein
LQSYNVGYYEICEQFQKYVFIMQRWAVRLWILLIAKPLIADYENVSRLADLFARHYH